MGGGAWTPVSSTGMTAPLRTLAPKPKNQSPPYTNS